MMRVWDVLGIPAGSDRDTIRRAYAKKLRATNPEDDPEGFKRLREAYEAALRQQDYAGTWHDAEEEVAAPPSAASDAPAAQPTGSTGEVHHEPEIAAILATRDAELAQLRAAMAALEAGLRGPWRPADADLEERLDAILRAPALGEIRVRSDIESWLAALLASTIPYSDAVLLQSIQAFGWNGDDHRLRAANSAVGAVLGRLDEWRIIEGLNHPSHSYNLAWRSLTSTPRPWWSWRLQAFRPGLVTGVETLFGEHGDVAPGLHYSFQADSVERWRQFLARPRLSLGILALAPIAFLTLLWLVYAVAGARSAASAWTLAPIAAIGLAAPAIALFTLPRWRQRWRAGEPHPAWLSQGWLAAHMLTAFIAMVLPPPWPVLIILPAPGIAVWVNVTAPVTRPGSLRLGGGIASAALAAFLTLTIAPELDPSEGFALGIMAALLAYLRVTRWSAVRAVLAERLWDHREWIILAGTAMGLAIALGVLLGRHAWDHGRPLYIMALALIALVPLVGPLERGAGGPPRWIARTALMLAFAWAFVVATPPPDRRGPIPATEAGSAPESAGTDGVTGGMAMLERVQPGFRQLRAGNPPLYAKVRGVMERYDSSAITRDQANKAIGELIENAYRQMAPEADSALLVEGFRIRLERQRALRKSAPSLCASNAPGDPSNLPDALLKREIAQTYNVISNPPAPAEERAAGKVIEGIGLSKRVAATLRIDIPTLMARLDGKQGPQAACDARIAITQALLDHRLDDIAATLRKQLIQARDSVPASSPRTSPSTPPTGSRTARLSV